MSKRVRFDEDSLISEKRGKFGEKEQPSSSKSESHLPGSRFKENHSIDSDEEEEVGDHQEEEFEKLTEEDVEGAENEDINEDYTEGGETVITPFNLKEEMAEGSFDKDGHYHFKKAKEIRDNWLDNIDWATVKKARNTEMPDADDDDEKDPFDERKVIEGIVQLLLKGETVSKGLRRLGGTDKTKKGKSRSWQREQMYDLEADEGEDNSKQDIDTGEEKKRQFVELTELADQMAAAGFYDIYTDTFEKLQHKLSSLQMTAKSSVNVTDGTDADDALDMFADALDTEDLEKPASNQQETNGDDGSVKWFYKWQDDATETFGPFTSAQMAEWKSQGYFKDGVKVKEENKPAFYDVRRIDFDLYD